MNEFASSLAKGKFASILAKGKDLMDKREMHEPDDCHYPDNCIWCNDNTLESLLWEFCLEIMIDNGLNRDEAVEIRKDYDQAISFLNMKF